MLSEEGRKDAHYGRPEDEMTKLEERVFISVLLQWI